MPSPDLEWDRIRIPRGEELCVLWSLSADVLSHLGHTSSRLLVDHGEEGEIDIETVAAAHGRGMEDRRRATGIPYDGEGLAWAHRMIDAVKRILEVWGPRASRLVDPQANVQLATPQGAVVEPDILHASGVVELKARARTRKARRKAKDQVLQHATAASHQGHDVPEVQVWSLLDGYIHKARLA